MGTPARQVILKKGAFANKMAVNQCERWVNYD
jgi:hypothetical protein